MAENTELELLITVVVAAEDDQTARTACEDLLGRLGGRIVESVDCSDEEPGCWSVTISRGRTETCDRFDSSTLARTVRNFLRELGPEYTRNRVCCEPPTAWTVVDNPELVEQLVGGGERLLVEAWLGSSGIEFGTAIPEPQAEDAAAHLSDLDENGSPRPRLELLVDVVTERRAGAEWPARALASRLSHSAKIVECMEKPPMVRVTMDLGPAPGAPTDIVRSAISALGGNGWSRLWIEQDTAMARWSAAPTPPSGIAAIELSAAEPSSTEFAP